MQHVKQIQDLIKSSRTSEAHAALDQLLELGPSNIDALKLRAYLYSSEGRFGREDEIWHQIMTLDSEDEDAHEYWYYRQFEDQEHMLFTEPFTGGCRYVGQPRHLVFFAFLGLIGCATFLLLGYLSPKYPILQHGWFAIGLFVSLIIMPWIGVFWSFVRGIKDILVTEDGIMIQTRLSTYRYLWGDLESVAILRGHDIEAAELFLMIKPRGLGSTPILVNIGQPSHIRARRFLVAQIEKTYEGLVFCSFADTNIDRQTAITL